MKAHHLARSILFHLAIAVVLGDDAAQLAHALVVLLLALAVERIE